MTSRPHSASSVTEPGSWPASTAGPREETRYGTTFGTVPEGASIVYVDSLGNLAMADNQASLALRLGIGTDRPVRITRA